MIPEACKSCKCRYNDVSEGHNCLKVPRKIVLPNGEAMNWPGLSVSSAIETCKGQLREPRMFGQLAFLVGL